MDKAAVAFRGAGGWRRLEVEAGPALLGEAGASFAALVRFAVESLSDGGGTADLAEGEDVDFKKAAFGLDGEAIAGADFARGA